MLLKVIFSLFFLFNVNLISQNIEIFSVKDPDYRKELQKELEIAKKENNYSNIAIIEYILRQENDPPMYQVFTTSVKTKIQKWIESEGKNFLKSNTSIVFSPFSTSFLSPGEIRVTIIEKNYEKKEIRVKTTGIKMALGIENAFEQVKSLIKIEIDREKIPTRRTNRKIAHRNNAVPKNGTAFSFLKNR
jgi:hypothetical protein